MGVRIYLSGSYCQGRRMGLIGPDGDGKINLPSGKKNLFVRNGTCGSAPLYHQERKPQYKFYGTEPVITNYDDEYHGQYDHILEVARDYWGLYVRSERWHYAWCERYYSENGKRWTYIAYCNEDKNREEFDKVIKNTDIPVQVRAEKCLSLCDSWFSWIEGWNNHYNYKIVDCEVALVDCVLSKKYYDFWELATETGVVIPPSDLKLALSKASEDLAASLPQTPINIAEALVDLVSVKNISNVFRTSEKVSAMLADSWLKWRYVYTTTKLDVRSMQEFLNRGLSLFDGATKKDYSCHGYAHVGDLTCRCSTTLQGRDLKEQFRRASQSLHTYDLWDLVPWSFVVDWFIPIGSMLQNLEYQSNLLKLEHGTIWYTCKWYEDSASENFMRFCTNAFVTTPCSIVNNQGPTNKTIAMRCIDAMALLIGR